MMTFQSQNGVSIKYILVYLSNVTGDNLFGLKTVSDRRDSCRVCPALYLRISDRRVTNDRYCILESTTEVTKTFCVSNKKILFRRLRNTDGEEEKNTVGYLESLGYRQRRIPEYIQRRIPGCMERRILYRIHGEEDTRIHGAEDTWIYGEEERIPEYIERGIPGYMGRRIPGYMERRIPGYIKRRIPGYMKRRIPGYMEKSRI